jgi:hypothetical protein
MKFAFVIAASVAFSVSTVAVAQDAAAPAADAVAPAAKPAKDPNRVICKSENVSGSLIATQKTCLTAAQWKDRAFRSGQWAEHMSTYNSQPNGR